MTLPDSYFR